MASRAQNDNDDDDRDTPSTSPNWLTGIVLPKIATGAANILSSFIANSSSSSSSSSSSDGFDSSPPDGSDNENDYPYFTCDETDRMNKENGNASAQLTRQKNETKNLIEKLILQETFSREERDCLISIIDSRVTDSSTIEKRLVIRSDTPDLRTKAIVEAKQWTEKKKEASKSKLKHDDSALLSQDNEGGLGSPVDMAKAYMRERPPWSSLSRKSAGEQTPSPVYGTSLSSSKRKASCLSSGSWSIKDEIRRVRSKATEEILKTVPSKKYNLSSFSLEPDGIQNTLLHRRIDSSSDFIASGVGTSGCLSVADISQENPLTENLQLKPITHAGSESAEDMRMVDEKNHVANGLRDSVIQEPVLEDDLRFTSKSCPTTDGDTELRGKAIDNGVALSGAREVEDHPRRVETCHLLSESSVEAPGIDENDDVAIDSSLSTKFTEEPLKALTRSNLKQSLKGKTTTNTEKRQGRKLSRYNKKTKGKD